MVAGEWCDDSFTRPVYASGDLGKRVWACRWATGLLGVIPEEAGPCQARTLDRL